MSGHIYAWIFRPMPEPNYSAKLLKIINLFINIESSIYVGKCMHFYV